jgi:hypothetical protein
MYSHQLARSSLFMSWAVLQKIRTRCKELPSVYRTPCPQAITKQFRTLSAVLKQPLNTLSILLGESKVASYNASKRGNRCIDAPC